GFTRILKPHGVATFEFPHLVQLVKNVQFDTIYHEHFSYLSFTAASKVFDTNGLQIFDVQEIPTHGGSLRIFAQRKDTGSHAVTPAVTELLKNEQTAGITQLNYYKGFQTRTDKIKDDLLAFLIETKKNNKT